MTFNPGVTFDPINWAQIVKSHGMSMRYKTRLARIPYPLPKLKPEEMITVSGSALFPVEIGRDWHILPA